MFLWNSLWSTLLSVCIWKLWFSFSYFTAKFVNATWVSEFAESFLTLASILFKSARIKDELGISQSQINWWKFCYIFFLLQLQQGWVGLYSWLLSHPPTNPPIRESIKMTKYSSTYKAKLIISMSRTLYHMIRVMIFND